MRNPLSLFALGLLTAGLAAGQGYVSGNPARMERTLTHLHRAAMMVVGVGRVEEEERRRQSGVPAVVAGSYQRKTRAVEGDWTSRAATRTRQDRAGGSSLLR